MAERYANDFATTLAAGINSSVTTITTAAAAPTALHSGEFRVRVGNEYMLVTAGQTGTSWTVTRGVEGSTAAAHLSADPVTHVLTSASLALSSASGLVVPIPAPSGDTTGAADTAAINAAITTCAAAGGGIVRAPARETYDVKPVTTRNTLYPSGSSGSRDVCIPIPNNVTLDMAGGTLKLRGSTEAHIVCNTLLDNSARNTDLGLVNAVIDGNSLAYTSHVQLHFSYVDRLRLENVKIINGSRLAGWVYAATDSVFDGIDAEDINGNAWHFGDPQEGGAVSNQVYDSWFGSLRAKDTTLFATPSQPGNPYVFVVTRCTIESIRVANTSAGLKLQQPSTDSAISLVHLDNCGESSELNSGMKLQGDPGYGAGKQRPTRIKIAQIVAINQANNGLYMYHTQDCSVGSYTGYNNGDLHSDPSDVYMNSGTNDHIGSVNSVLSQGGGIRIQPSVTGYRIDDVRITNPGQKVTSGIKSGLRVDGASDGSVGNVLVVDDQGSPTLSRAVDVTDSAAKGTIQSLRTTGGTDVAFVSASVGFKNPQLDRTAYKGPTGTILESVPRTSRLDTVAVLQTGRLHLQLLGLLRKGQKVTNVGYCSGGTAAGTPTHWFFCLYDEALAKLANTADQTTTAWAANTSKVLALTTPYVAPQDMVVYAGIVVVATTPPSLIGSVVTAGGDAVALLAPGVSGLSTSSLTVPGDLPATAGALSYSDMPYSRVT